MGADQGKQNKIDITPTSTHTLKHREVKSGDLASSIFTMGLYGERMIFSLAAIASRQLKTKTVWVMIS